MLITKDGILKQFNIIMVYGCPVSFGGVLANLYWLMGAHLVSGECLQVFISYWWVQLVSGKRLQVLIG